MEKTSKNKSVRAVPQGYHTVTPYLLANNAAGLIEFMEKAFDAKMAYKMLHDDKSILHAAVTIGDSTIMLADSMEGHPAQQGMLYLYLENVDEVFQKALRAKATSVREVQDEFYGDRAGAVKDPWGNTWWISTHVEDVSDEELEKRAKEMKLKNEMHA